MADHQPPSAIRNATGFIPKELVSLQIGRYYAKVYPTVDQGMCKSERAHAFQIAISAFKPLPMEPRMMLDALGSNLSCGTTVDGHISDWTSHFKNNWMNWANLTIMNFHDSAGNVINNSTTAADSSILLPVVNGAVAACRQGDVRFVRVQCTLDFAALVTLDPPGNTTLRVSYYIELPQSTVPMINGAAAAYNLTTFHGAADLRTLLPADVQAQVLDLVLQDGPVMLTGADFNLNDANIDGEVIQIDIGKKVLKLATPSITAAIFHELCPGHSAQPHAAIEHIKQTFISGGETISTSVYVYYQSLQRAARPIATDPIFPISLCNKFIDGLDDRLLPGFRRIYPAYTIQQDLSGQHQRRELPLILQAAQQAEDELTAIQEIARNAVGQAFLANGSALASQAENTLSTYQQKSSHDRGRGTAGRKKPECFGCGGEHPWMVNGEIVCKLKDNDGIRERALVNYKKFNERMKKLRGERKRKGGGDHVSFDKLSSANQEKMRKAVYASRAEDDMSVASSVTNGSRSPMRDGSRSPVRARTTFNGSMVLMIDVQRATITDVSVFAAGAPPRMTLPVPIQTAFPHIQIQTGTKIGCPNCPVLRVVIDTAASLNTGNFHYYAKIAKAFPHIVAAIHAPTDYSPIVLSGIVQQDGQSVTCELNVAFAFHLPYLTTEGQNTTLLVATGPHVTVNTIVGLPFIQSTRMIIDAADHVAELKALDTSPFPIEYRRATVHVPMIDETNVPVNLARYKDVIQEVQNLEKYFADKCAASKPAILKNGRPRVHFGTSALAPAVPGEFTVDGINGGAAASLDNAVQALPANLMNDSISDYHDPMMGFPVEEEMFE